MHYWTIWIRLLDQAAKILTTKCTWPNLEKSPANSFSVLKSIAAWLTISRRNIKPRMRNHGGSFNIAEGSSAASKSRSHSVIRGPRRHTTNRETSVDGSIQRCSSTTKAQTHGGWCACTSCYTPRDHGEWILHEFGAHFLTMTMNRWMQIGNS